MKKSPLLPFLALLAPLATTSQAHADIQAKTLIRQYDDSKTQVITPEIGVSSTFNKDQMKVEAGYTQDILTSASTDVVTYSSAGKISERREEMSGSFEFLIPDGSMSVGYIQSDENDYHSKTVTAGGTREFNTKNTTIAWGFANGDDNIRTTKGSFSEAMDNQTYTISLTQVLSKASLFQLSYDFRIENGYLSSPYRRAKFMDSIGQGSAQSENHPRTRNRNAWALAYNHYIGFLNISTATNYRLYQDSWGVLSHTIEERITREWTRKFATSFSFRYYTQGKANFYEDYYDPANPPLFYTGNKTLGTFDSILLGIRPTYQVTDYALVFLKGEYFTQNFKDVTDQGPNIGTKADDKKLEINAFVVGVGLDLKF